MTQCTQEYLGSLLHVLFIQSFSFWCPSTEVFPCLSHNLSLLILLKTEKSILRKQHILFIEWAFLLEEVFLKIHNPKDCSFRTSAKKKITSLNFRIHKAELWIEALHFLILRWPTLCAHSKHLAYAIQVCKKKLWVLYCVNDGREKK